MRHRWAARTAPWLRVAPTLVVVAWGGNHFTPLLLAYERYEGFSVTEANLFLAFYILGLVPGFALAGPLSDRYGRKRLLFASLALALAGTAVLGLGGSSALLLCLGRLVSGLSVAAAMVVGTTAVKELSIPPWDRRADAATGASRAAMSLTVGFGVGAGVSGAIAQWAPLPTLTPYLVHAPLVLLAGFVLFFAPESTTAHPGSAPLLAGLRVPIAARGTMLKVVLPLAPWVFGAGALAYAVVPSLTTSLTGELSIAFAALLTVLALGVGTVAQAVTRTVAARLGRSTPAIGLGLVVLGTLGCAWQAASPSIALALLIAVVLGAGYGISMVAGLIEVQRVADPEHLAGLTGIYYSLTYIGFALPYALSLLEPLAGYPALLIGLAVLVALCLARLVRR